MTLKEIEKIYKCEVVVEKYDGHQTYQAYAYDWATYGKNTNLKELEQEIKEILELTG